MACRGGGGGGGGGGWHLRGATPIIGPKRSEPSFQSPPAIAHSTEYHVRWPSNHTTKGQRSPQRGRVTPKGHPTSPRDAIGSGPHRRDLSGVRGALRLTGDNTQQAECHQSRDTRTADPGVSGVLYPPATLRGSSQPDRAGWYERSLHTRAPDALCPVTEAARVRLPPHCATGTALGTGTAEPPRAYRLRGAEAPPEYTCRALLAPTVSALTSGHDSQPTVRFTPRAAANHRRPA